MCAAQRYQMGRAGGKDADDAPIWNLCPYAVEFAPRRGIVI